MIGRTLSHYQVLERIGAGGMGEVYRALDTRLGREVALKALPETLARDSDRLARLEREAKTVAALNHPNIATLYSIEEADGVRFLTMELVEGQRLDALLVPRGLPLRILDFALPLTGALVAAHEKGIVHRDLKPANVMVTNDGRPKVLDFGLAKLATSAGATGLDATQAAGQATTVSAPLTSTGHAVGTVPYMAPEQLRGRTVDARTDLFALGIILYGLVTGRHPFTGESLSDVTSSILRDTPVPVAAVRKDVPATLVRIVERCLEKDPARRYPTAREVHEELRLLRRDLEAGVALAAALTPIQADAPSIAVLPFVNIGKDEEDDYFADGLSEELLSVLSKIRGLRVTSRTSAFYFKGRDVDLATMAQRLNVATVLEGSVRKAGKRVRITAQLIQVATDSHLWSQTYDRELEDIFAVQDDIAQSVAMELRAALLGEKPDASASAAVKAEVAAAAKGRGENAEAYRLYLQGRFFADRYAQEDVAKAIEYYRQALKLDPGYALAWAGLSGAYAAQSAQGWAPFAEGYGRARDAAVRALQLEPDLGEGHSALGRVRTEHDWDWNGADASCRRALELGPGNSEVLTAAADLASILGRLEDAIAFGRRAVALDPLSVPAHRRLSLSCLHAALLDEAEAEVKRMLEISSQGGLAHVFLGRVHLLQGRLAEALAEMKREPKEPSRLQGLALVHHAAGRTAESDAALCELVEKYAGSYAVQIAIVNAHRGELDRAFEWLERAYAQRDPGLARMKTDPFLRNLHLDSRWQPFLEKMGLAD